MYPMFDVCYPLNILSRFKNLIALELGAHQTLDESIGSLVTLRTLTLNGNKYVTDKMLKNLTRITTLSLRAENEITGGSLKYLTNITDLCLQHNNKITDVTLKNLTKISNLTLFNNKLISDESMICLINITCLRITNCDLVTDSSIKNLTNITHLGIDGADNVTYKSLKYLTSLRAMYLCNHKIDCYKFAKLINLRSLAIYDGAHITEIIKHLTRLELLMLYSNYDVTHEDICKLTNLKRLYLNNCPLIREDKIRDKLPNLKFERW